MTSPASGTLPPDLRDYSVPSWWRDLADEEQSRIAGALSATAIVMLLVTSFTLARGVQWYDTTGAAEGQDFKSWTAHTSGVPYVNGINAASTINAAGTTSPVASSAGPAAPFDCPRLQGRQWLRSAIWQQGDRTLAGVECYYGSAATERFVQ